MNNQWQEGCMGTRWPFPCEIQLSPATPQHFSKKNGLANNTVSTRLLSNAYGDKVYTFLASWEYCDSIPETKQVKQMPLNSLVQRSTPNLPYINTKPFQRSLKGALNVLWRSRIRCQYLESLASRSSTGRVLVVFLLRGPSWCPTVTPIQWHVLFF